MLQIKQKQMYSAFSLNLLSDLPMPELELITNMAVHIDVEIKIEEKGYYKKELESNPYQHFVINDEVMFNVPNIANFYIKGGNEVIVSLLDEVDDDVLRLYILGTCMGTILLQRKILPLHGSAVEIEGKVYAIIGDSGAGKSTLASALIKKGYRLVSDDIIAVSRSKENSIPYIIPAYPQQKLWEDSLELFGIETNHFRSIYGRENKYCIPVTENFLKTSLPLAGVFELVKSDDSTCLSELEKLESIHTLMKNTYRNFLIPRLGLMDWHFHTSTGLLEYMDVYRLCRSATETTTEQLVCLILDTIRKKG